MKRLNLLAAAGLVLFSAMPASAQSGTKVGLLSCNMSPTIGLIVGSHQRIQCRFTPDAGGRPAPELRTSSREQSLPTRAQRVKRREQCRVVVATAVERARFAELVHHAELDSKDELRRSSLRRA